MTGVTTTYNERSWAIDLIGYLKHLSQNSNRSIRDAGGEHTINSEGGSLFPDVLLFGDLSTARILQGWELKMPDTSIDNHEFRNNAETKARALGLDSFLLWNVSHARLYVRDERADQFGLSCEWSTLDHITTRGAVVANRIDWQNLASEIYAYLNDLFDRGTLEGRRFIDAYRSGGVTALIMENAPMVADALSNAAKRDLRLKSQMVLWWERYRAEYASGTMEQVLSQVVISNWIGKILFSHILREKDIRARSISNINDNTTPVEALAIFQQLTQDCNFWTIFSDSLGLSVIPEQAWDQLKQFNHLLTDLRVGSVDQGQLSGILEATVEVAVRKLRGQYPTPIELARLLVNLCVRDVLADRVLDPCCGSGTIPRAALEQKIAANVPIDVAARSVFAGDQDLQAVQIATFALAKPNLMNIPLRIYQRDVFTLDSEMEVDFRNPINGELFSEVFGRFDAITSNLPFVAQAGRKQYGNALQGVIERIGEISNSFSRRADVAAYLPFSLHPLLNDGGRLGIIITNAWLGTDWGDSFYRSLGLFYDLKCVITSGAGRWFQNSEIVTNILIMEKKTNPDQESGDVKFVVMTRPLEEIRDDNDVMIAAAQIELGQTQNDTMTIRSVSPSRLDQFRILGLGGNAQFVNCNWILNLPLTRLSNFFAVRRGERRGMNDFFYPRPGHGIEAEYIRPLAKGPSDFRRLSDQAAKEAFSCSRTEEELEQLGHIGALNWIRQFKTEANISKLQTSSQFWYEMRADTLTDLVMFINYGERLFVGRINPPAFADQRLVRLVPCREAIDIELCHALLNSVISMFIIEGMGFGRGLGALDLNKDRIEGFMHFLDPTLLDIESAERIKAAFAPLLNRNILSVADELEQDDRRAFDDAVIAAYNLKVDRNHIYDCLLTLVEIRMTANS